MSRTFTVRWTEDYEMTGIKASSEEEAIEKAKNKCCSRRDEGENITVYNFNATEE